MKLTKLLLLFLPFLTIAQGYYNSENFGNRSLLLSGNVTGSVEDLGLTYYNPARIALLEAPVFSINAKAYQVSTLSLENVFGRDSELSDSRFEGVPSLLAGTFNIPKWENHHFAYSFLSKQRNRVNINARRATVEGGIVDEIEGAEEVISKFNLDNTENDEWFGLTWGTKIRDNFSIGVSTFVSVYNFKGKYDLRLAELDENDNVSFYNNVINYGQTSYGIFWKVGLAWKLKGFDIGLNIDLPYVEVVNSGKFNYAEILASNDGSDIFDYGEAKDLDTKRKEPIGVSLGAGIPWKKNTIHLKMDWHGAVGEYDRLVIPPFDTGNGQTDEFNFTEELKSVINFGLGAEFYLSEKVDLFASFSTDFSPLVTSANIFDLVGDADTDINLVADYMHYGVGVDLKFPRAQITIGTTYSTASGEFDRPIDFPDPEGIAPPQNEDPSKFGLTRWRFIVGLEFPIFGYDVNFK
jgi:hypothetical protein